MQFDRILRNQQDMTSTSPLINPRGMLGVIVVTLGCAGLVMIFVLIEILRLAS